MGSSVPTPSDAAPEPVGRRPPRIQKKRRTSPATVYAAVFAVLIVAAILVQFAVHVARTDPRDSRTIAERELTINTLTPNERVIRSVSVFKRPAISYFRATRGLLVLTNKRMLYLGLEPRDLLAAPDLPPTFEQRDFPLDTSVHVSTGRTFFGLARAIVIESHDESLRLGVPSGAWPQASLLVTGMEVRHENAIVGAKEQQAFLAKAEVERKAAEAARRTAKFYTVRRGDAIGSIATQWEYDIGPTPRMEQAADNKIRVGQVLMVKPAL